MPRWGDYQIENTERRHYRRVAAHQERGRPANRKISPRQDTRWDTDRGYSKNTSGDHVLGRAISISTTEREISANNGQGPCTSTRRHILDGNTYGHYHKDDGQ
eukprot:5306090-Pyramimonas_sp.AAC.1